MFNTGGRQIHKYTLICTRTHTQHSILLGLWEVSVTAVDMCAVSIPVKKGIDSARLNQRLYSVLLLLKEFYHSGGDGLSEEDINSESYTVSMSDTHYIILCVYTLTYTHTHTHRPFSTN